MAWNSSLATTSQAEVWFRETEAEPTSQLVGSASVLFCFLQELKNKPDQDMAMPRKSHVLE